jgi:hypothetical protein
MLGAKRTAVVCGLAIFAALYATAPAFADDIYGSVNCSQTPSPACDLGAGHSSAPGQNGGGQGTGAGNHGGGGAATPTGASCQWISVGGSGNGQQGRPGPPGQEGTWYVQSCLVNGSWTTDPNTLTWVPLGAAAPAGNPQPAPPSPAQLAEIARKQLQFPMPSIAANPNGEQLVSLPTWLWLSEGWRTVSATVAVPGVSVTATATPTSVTWSMGDGSTVACAGPGTPFAPGSDPKASSPDCGHTYRTSSASQAGQAFPVTATVHWTVTWAGAGQGGVFPDMTTTGNAAFRVAESQALNNGG